MRNGKDSKEQLVKVKLCALLLGMVLWVVLSGKIMPGEKETEVAPETALRAEEAAPKDREPKNPERKGEETEPGGPVYGEQIRVLLKTTDFLEEMHESVELTAECEMSIRGAEGEDYGEASAWTFSWEEEGLILNGEVLAEVPQYFEVELTKENAKGISVMSLERGYGNPVYEGRLEIWPAQAGFFLINEVPVETYLGYVVPSEMPASYEPEALKAQAVCARTYACRQMQEYAYPEYQAHVDDSVQYQVYNNTGKAESTTGAVRDTAGIFLTYEGMPITAYYFSTSCGHTGNEELWREGDSQLTPYLTGKTVNSAGEVLDLGSEEAFEAFLCQEDPTSYDADISWYRWQAEVDVETLSDNFNQAFRACYPQNPEVLQRKKKSEELGRIQKIEILERNAGGAVQKIRVTGSKNTITAETEYMVRSLLNVQGENILRKDGSTVEGGGLLPSAYFTIEPVWNEKGEATDFAFLGGGYGHGVGMSQNGANKMAKEGKSFEEILKFFYTGVELENQTCIS